jgi:hypothetical protein
MEVPRKTDESLLNRAYCCFGFLGLVTLPFGLAALLEAFGLVSFDVGSGGVGAALAGWVELFEFTLAIPLFVAMLSASVYGVWRTVQFPHSGLVALSVISIVCGGGYLILLLTVSGGGRGAIGDVAEIVLGIYIAANVFIPA